MRIWLAMAVLVACGSEPTQSPTGSASSSSGSGGGGGEGGGETEYYAVNGCDPETAADETGKGVVTITMTFDGSVFKYDPPCVTVDLDTTVVIHGESDTHDFMTHPLQGGEKGKPDEESPFGFVGTDGQTAESFEMTELGTFPYYCVAHVSQNMMGCVYVK